jgi:hypothetical protein
MRTPLEATLTFNLKDPQERQWYEKCLKIIQIQSHSPQTKGELFKSSLSARPWKLVAASKQFAPDATWTLAEWATAAEMTLDSAKALLGPIARVTRNLGWSPFKTIVQGQSHPTGIYLYKFSEGGREAIETLLS